ncbi:GGDEF domain-containing protein [Undibacterium pigrum]|uniref:diguanylate cyclase n=1 Tax=Undibacterium pigrum TaxID=401470 RepID=A0A318JEE8_9BURK|nr:GGDEF domain-containing protein [Undibacterium pigrum]PXX46926.1 diguanylate cyclase (GGDEF)-like protein [Undibacterium pigrum]
MMHPTPSWTEHIKAAAITGIIVFAACVLGILSRPMGHLAALWPANALLIGLFVRFPKLNNAFGWLGAILAYFMADIMTGNNWSANLMLTAGNLVCVVTGVLLFSWLDEEHRRLKHPLSVLYLALVASCAAAATGVVGVIADPILSNANPLKNWAFWSVIELANLMAVLPVMLSLPDLSGLRLDRRRAFKTEHFHVSKILPVCALLISLALGIIVGGPGALVFPIPALLWCALSYDIFITSILTLLYSGWVLIAMSLGYLPISIVNMNSRPMLLSIRIGVSLMALAPLTVACVMAAREELLRQLKYIAEHDQLTALLNRRAFNERAANLLARLSEQTRPVAVLMLDIDKFKDVNDTYGHAGGDRVLVAFARIASAGLRNIDMLGRIGGEEFAAVLPGCGQKEAAKIAQRIRSKLADTSIDLGDGQQITVTVSIGVSFAQQAIPDIEALLLVADKALYRAKENGRNRVESDDLDA